MPTAKNAHKNQPNVSRKDTRAKLRELYTRLYGHFGPQNWWPADSPFEVVVGAILTQNTSWLNVEKAIANLKRAGIMELEAMRQTPSQELSELIRPAGYYNLKEQRLRNVLNLIARRLDGRIESLADLPLDQARELMLSAKGVGPETADSILLYAASMPSFVVDAYTKRVLSRHRIIKESDSYHEVRAMFMGCLEHDPALFNEYHALIVRLAKTFCNKRNFRCAKCPADGI
jgi:endonuclease-3 related protein